MGCNGMFLDTSGNNWQEAWWIEIVKLRNNWQDAFIIYTIHIISKKRLLIIDGAMFENFWDYMEQLKILLMDYGMYLSQEYKNLYTRENCICNCWNPYQNTTLKNGVKKEEFCKYI